MKLFLFGVAGEHFALPGEVVAQILPPGAIRAVGRDRDGEFVERDGTRLPVWRIPGITGGSGLRTAEATFLRVHLAGAEGLVQVDDVAGLSERRTEEVLPVPTYLFPAGQAMYRGVFEAGCHLVGLLDPARLVVDPGAR